MDELIAFFVFLYMGGEQGGRKGEEEGSQKIVAVMEKKKAY